MKVVEILQIGQNLLEMLQKSCIKVSDVKYIGMYEEYSDMVANGNKISYIAAVLSTKYNISERQFFYIIKRFEQDCKIGAM
jgi:hypothetical protein